MIKIYRILLRHFLIGIAITAIIFWSINEIPGLYYFQEHLTEWIATIVSIPVIVFLMAKLLFKQLIQTNNRIYLYSFLTILITWILILYAKAAVVGIVDSIERSKFKFVDSLSGATIYQLWFYLGVGIIHGIIGGIFLRIDLKNNLFKREKTIHNKG